MRTIIRSQPLILTSTILVGLIISIGCGGPVEQETEELVQEAQQVMDDMRYAQATPEIVARAELSSLDTSLAEGSVTFTEAQGQVTIRGQFSGVMPPGQHGLHVHEVGDCSPPDFSSAGGHFNPLQAPHACPPDEARHAGDLGNVVIADDGTGSSELITNLLTVSDGPLSVVGRAVILHADADDCTTQPTGAAGKRLACGVITLVSEPQEAPQDDEASTTGG